MRASRFLRFPQVILLALAASVAGATAASAQTVVSNPTTVTFTPSSDHAALGADGLPLVDHYSLDIYSVGASQPFQASDIGKPAPAADGLIYYDFSGTVASWPLPGGNYEARVAAVGATGTGLSAASNPFTFDSCGYTLASTSAAVPAAGGTVPVGLSTGSGCAWTAASAVAWASVAPTSGTGSSTVTVTVAANTSTSSRTGTATIGSRLFTINQAAASTSTGTVPAAPSAPSPGNGAIDVSTSPTLTWSAAGATTYTVRFGTVSPPPQVATGVTSGSYAPGKLAPSTTYYWQVVAVNATGSTAGPVWTFSTVKRGKKK